MENTSLEPAISRVDVFSCTQTFSINGVSPAAWMEKLNKFGYVLQRNGNSADYQITVQTNCLLTFVFRGPDFKDEHNNTIENWVNFTKASINGKDIISSDKPVWHNRSYTYTREVKKGDILNLHIEWKKYEKQSSKSEKPTVTIINIGESNTISIPNNLRSRTIINVYGNNNKVIMDKVPWFAGEIHVGTQDCPVNNCLIKIGKGTTSNGTAIYVLEDNSEVNIGEDCLFSWGIQIFCSDTHTITDMNGKIINIGKSVTIGNHVWVGTNVCIAKNSYIPDGCVVGMGSVVCSTKGISTNSIIAGNPAKVVKEQICWNKLRPKQYIMQNDS